MVISVIKSIARDMALHGIAHAHELMGAEYKFCIRGARRRACAPPPHRVRAGPPNKAAEHAKNGLSLAVYSGRCDNKINFYHPEFCSEGDVCGRDAPRKRALS
jgi:hypothetical protein